MSNRINEGHRHALIVSGREDCAYWAEHLVEEALVKA